MPPVADFEPVPTGATGGGALEITSGLCIITHPTASKPTTRIDRNTPMNAAVSGRLRMVRRTPGSAEVGLVAAALRAAPHSTQNFAPAIRGVPHCGQ